MNPIALASGVLPEFGALAVIDAAARAQFDMVGLWVDPAVWNSTDTQACEHALRKAGMPVIDVEVLWYRDGEDIADHKRILDIGARLGAANALCVSSRPDPADTIGWLNELCCHAESTGIRVALEFGIFTAVKDLAAARAIIAAVDHPLAAILIDPIHVDRSGTQLAEIAALDPALLPYAQFCDAPARRPDPADFNAIITDAVDLRQQCGSGALDLLALYRALPAEIPLSIELRSKALRNAFLHDPVGRACAVAQQTRRWLEQNT
ncbi:TIM barrel protein [Croceicoccus sp. F390]|uniref:TIM barrel protein n=1 Tax=Croceicoccus esteveae TaxID=3075597 RepID=A0ABU2ZHZ8_9SPHN|nr:TIM barrel protein [Croceicoccus sp. F390]MDT0575986.1 TIM barrel protein [Croceicoccus sp. F390]